MLVSVGQDWINVAKPRPRATTLRTAAQPDLAPLVFRGSRFRRRLAVS